MRPEELLPFVCWNSRPSLPQKPKAINLTSISYFDILRAEEKITESWDVPSYYDGSRLANKAYRSCNERRKCPLHALTRSQSATARKILYGASGPSSRRFNRDNQAAQRIHPHSFAEASVGKDEQAPSPTISDM
ncbi:hypothetical protein RvY_14053 [Ramazzottius varieornatus]|uniref:Uncharacterized protein n=1 Tax=Ramazzottius varieornatus TaxID=947166 RepID=A0A1D1VYH3_RAMVA|nr:hypothetical protein RvY_14053 [Ramazzottius varieornatus]